VLRREATRRGIALGDEVIGYLMTHFARDLGSLMAVLAGIGVDAGITRWNSLRAG